MLVPLVGSVGAVAGDAGRAENVVRGAKGLIGAGIARAVRADHGARIGAAAARAVARAAGDSIGRGELLVPEERLAEVDLRSGDGVLEGLERRAGRGDRPEGAGLAHGNASFVGLAQSADALTGDGLHPVEIRLAHRGRAVLVKDRGRGGDDVRLPRIVHRSAVDAVLLRALHVLPGEGDLEGVSVVGGVQARGRGEQLLRRRERGAGEKRKE